MLAEPLGVLPPIAGPDIAPFSLGEPWQRGSPGAGTGEMPRLKACVAVWPLASLTRTVKNDVPTWVGEPGSVPSGLRVRPGGSVPAATDHASGVAKSPSAEKPERKKLFTIEL